MSFKVYDDTKEWRNVKSMIKKMKIGSVISILMICVILIKQVVSSNVSSIGEFQHFMSGYGILGLVILTCIQAVQVVIPILPGYLGCAVGAISYGPVLGFICTYIGISVGSIIAFYLADRFGKKLVIEMFSEKYFEKWKAKFEGKKSYDWFMFIATVLPLFPDDFLCYFSGLIGMDKKRFIWIIILGKPWCILGYSILFGLIK